LYGTMTLRGDTEDVARQTALLAAQYQEITRQFPKAPASADNLKKTVEIAQKLRENTHNPQRVMVIVSRALEASPNVVVKELGWKYGATDIDPERRTQPGAGSGTPSPSGTGLVVARRESALIEGEVRPFRGDYRSAIITINRFAEQLGEESDVAEVRVVKLPLNVNPTQPLSGNTVDNPEQSANATAEFRLLLVLKPTT
jgi:hypothetical protein